MNIWNDPNALVGLLNTNSTDDDTLAILKQYNKEVHKCVLKEFIQNCLEKNQVDTMRDFLACFQNIFRRVGHMIVWDEDNYNNPFYTIRVYIEAAIWNWPHSSDMDTVLISYSF